MLIFDNIIFASFIPQFLMFLGFVSCLIVPFFSAHQTTEAYLPNEANLLEFSVNVEQKISTVHFYDFQDIQSDIILNDDTENPLIFEFYEYRYSKYNDNFRFSEVNYTQFSRPPPLGVFFF